MDNKMKRFGEWQMITDSDSQESEEFWGALALKQLQEFIEAEVDVNAKNNDGDAPLILAIKWSNDIEIIRALIKAGADIHAKNFSGDTPLHEAAIFADNVEIIKELIEAGADIHAKDNGDCTPLHEAAIFADNVEIIKELIEAGADVHAKDFRGETPYDLLLESDALKNNKEAKALLNPTP